MTPPGRADRLPCGPARTRHRPSLTPAMHVREAPHIGLDYRYETVDLIDVPTSTSARARAPGVRRIRRGQRHHPFKQQVLAARRRDQRRRGADRRGQPRPPRPGARVAHNTDYSGFRFGLERFLGEGRRGTVLQVGAGRARAGHGLCPARPRLRRGRGPRPLEVADERLAARFGVDRLRTTRGDLDGWLTGSPGSCTRRLSGCGSTRHRAGRRPALAPAPGSPRWSTGLWRPSSSPARRAPRTRHAGRRRDGGRTGRRQHPAHHRARAGRRAHACPLRPDDRRRQCRLIPPTRKESHGRRPRPQRTQPQPAGTPGARGVRQRHPRRRRVALPPPGRRPRARARVPADERGGRARDVAPEAGPGRCLGAVLNAGAYTHTSVALRDAVVGAEVPDDRGACLERARARGVPPPLASSRRSHGGVVVGLGVVGYELAIRALHARREAR